MNLTDINRKNTVRPSAFADGLVLFRCADKKIRFGIKKLFTNGECMIIIQAVI